MTMDNDDSLMLDEKSAPPGGTQNGAGVNGTANGANETVWCVECEDVAASLKCEACGDNFCGLCFQWQHRSGKRAQHKPTPLPGQEMFKETAAGTTQHFMQMQKEAQQQKQQQAAPPVESGQAGGKLIGPRGLTLSGEAAYKWIPMRVSGEERTLLKLLEGALEVSEYTDKVDVVRGWGWRNSKSDVIGEEISDFFKNLMGLLVAGNYQEGVKLLQAKELRGNAEFFAQVCEIGRRFKITNPEKLRSTYGKLIYLMQDAPSVLPFNLHTPIKSVHLFLSERDGLGVLADEELALATRPIAAGDAATGASREALEQAGRDKAAAADRIAARHAGNRLSAEDIRWALLSVGDLYSYVEQNQAPVREMIELLEENFTASKPTGTHSLEISMGMRGSKLSHTHSTHYTFVLQSLHLWREVTQNMFRLWILAEGDLLNQDNSYRLMNTGQGMNRVQAAPAIGSAMHKILSRVQGEVGAPWVGLSVVHLGDRDVPNALVFIDKYTQVARLLDPVVRTVRALPRLARDPATAKIIREQFGGEEQLRLEILGDFFRHGFDGSGSDGGSCIDGRLTSAWNWCSRLEKKAYYPVFLLAGFHGFDGDFRK